MHQLAPWFNRDKQLAALSEFPGVRFIGFETGHFPISLKDIVLSAHEGDKVRGLLFNDVILAPLTDGGSSVNAGMTNTLHFRAACACAHCRRITRSETTDDCMRIGGPAYGGDLEQFLPKLRNFVAPRIGECDDAID